MSFTANDSGLLVPTSYTNEPSRRVVETARDDFRVMEFDSGFSFGEPEPVLNSNGMVDYLHCYFNGRYWEPPVDRTGLTKLRHASVYHPSAIEAKVNILLATTEIVDKSMVTYDDLEALATDYLIYGEYNVQGLFSRTHKLSKLKHAHSLYTRRLKRPDAFGYLHGYGELEPFKVGSVLQVRKYDPAQEIYGLPAYLSAVNSILLKENAVLFRRKYYKNNAHMGFILYISDPAIEDPAIDKIEESLKNAKGPGNFKNMVVHAPNGDKDGMQLISVSEFAAKDEFFNMHKVSTADQLAIHRVPWELMGIVPEGATQARNLPDVAAVFAMNENTPFQRKLSQINAFVGREVLKFHPYELPGSEGGDAGEGSPPPIPV